ncbi:MAG: SDR family oxidoreductase [Balneolaceae bacterium]|nr:SDR family oxidoreductase [Balneolaceae bacterium]
MKLLLTGATGFLGSRLLFAIVSNSGFDLCCASRQSSRDARFKSFKVPGLHSGVDWSEALFGQEVVVHSAARAHIMKEEVSDPLAEYRRVNVEGTLGLARQAAAANVKRFIFVSSIKVNGEQTKPGVRFSLESKPKPGDNYGLSKWEAEQGLWDISKDTGMEVVIVRPPLVYGPRVKGNFASMMTLATRNLPLPLGAVNNKRSLVALDNLVDLIIRCIDHPAAANQTFLVSDDQDVSTTELLTMITKAAGNKPRLIPVPLGLLRLGAAVLGKKAVADRLLGNLQVDITHTKDTLGWKPPISVEEGIRRCFEEDSRQSKVDS